MQSLVTVSQYDHVRNIPRTYAPMSRLLCEDPDSVKFPSRLATSSRDELLLSGESANCIALYRYPRYSPATTAALATTKTAVRRLVNSARRFACRQEDPLQICAFDAPWVCIACLPVSLLCMSCPMSLHCIGCLLFSLLCISCAMGLHCMPAVSACSGFLCNGFALDA